MTVNELIKVLKTMPQDMKVYSREPHNGTFTRTSIGVRISNRVSKSEAVVVEGTHRDEVGKNSYEEWLDGTE